MTLNLKTCRIHDCTVQPTAVTGYGKSISVPIRTAWSAHTIPRTFTSPSGSSSNPPYETSQDYACAKATRA